VVGRVGAADAGSGVGAGAARTDDADGACRDSERGWVFAPGACQVG
jgi:hypothetical protein